MLIERREWWSVWLAVLFSLFAAGFLGNLASRPGGPGLDMLPSSPAQESSLAEPHDGTAAGDLSPMKEPLQYACPIHEPMGHNLP